MTTSASANLSALPETQRDRALLNAFVETRSNAAFAEFVNRHLDFVYATALRRLAGDAHLAHDVSQAVFTDVAQHARRVASAPVLSGWLHSATCFAAAKAVRSEQRRRARETRASAMHDSLHDSARDEEWSRLQPVIDDALAALKESDRHAILLRFFQAHSYSQIGAQLQLTENAARMRVDRALEQLRSRLSKLGILSTAGALATVLTAHASVSAPAGAAASICTTALASTVGTGATGWFLSTLGLKLQVASTAVVLVAGSAGIVWEKQEQHLARAEQAALAQQQSSLAALRSENQTLATRLAALRAASPTSDEVAQARSEVIRLLGTATQRAVAENKSSPSSSQTTPAQRFDLRELDSAPVPTAQRRPVYPRDLRQARISGEAMVEFVVDADGKVRDAKIKSSSHRSLEGPVLEAVGRWQFRPGVKDGKPVQTRMAVPFVFQLNDADPAWF